MRVLSQYDALPRWGYSRSFLSAVSGRSSRLVSQASSRCGNSGRYRSAIPPISAAIPSSTERDPHQGPSGQKGCDTTQQGRDSEQQERDPHQCPSGQKGSDNTQQERDSEQQERDPHQCPSGQQGRDTA